MCGLGCRDPLPSENIPSSSPPLQLRYTALSLGRVAGFIAKLG